MRITILLASLLIVASASASLDAYVQFQQDPFCGYANGSVTIGVQGGTAPYTFSWDDGPTTQDRTGLAAGTYTLTVMDALSATTQVVATLTDQPEMYIPESLSYVFDGSTVWHPCPGVCNGALTVFTDILLGAPPYSIGFSDGAQLMNTDQMGHPQFGPFCADESVSMFITDNNGCHGTWPNEVISGPAGLPVQVLGTSGSCNGANDGSVLIQIPVDPGSFPVDLRVVNDLGDTVAAHFLVALTSDQFTGLAPGNYTLRQSWPYTADPTCHLDFPFIVTDLGANCGSVSGTLFIDHDQNCTEDLIDIPVPQRLLQIDPGPAYAITDDNGQYAANLPFGSYSASVLGTGLMQICPVQTPAPFDITALVPNVTLNLADSSTVPLDLAVFQGTGAAHPGFTFSYAARVENSTAALSGPLTVTLSFDPQLTFISASPVPASVVGNVVTWNEAPLLSYGQQGFHVLTQIPADPGLIGTYLGGSVNVSQVQTESDLSNNSASFHRLVTGGFDPNDKRVEPGDIFLLDVDDYLNYTIEFQNTGNDTAFTVVVVDTLSSDLDPATLQLGASSHDYAAHIAGSGVLSFTFSNILLPDSNTNEPLSHGFVCFRIRPRASVMPGTLLTNEADIYFDLNPPITTPSADVMADASVNVHGPGQGQVLLRLVPNPARERISIVGLEANAAIDRIDVLAVDGRSLIASRTGPRTIDISSLEGGAYLLTIHFADGGIITQRFIKN